MNDFFSFPGLVPWVAVAVVGLYFVGGRFAIAGSDRKHANFRAGALAQRLGLNLVAGDPSFNLFVRYANKDVRRGPSDKRPLHIELRAEGAPQGVPLEFVYLHRVEQDSGFTEVTRRNWFDCHLSAKARQPFPPFEVVSRDAPVGIVAQTLALPPTPTGNPTVDAAYLVTTEEPAMARVLGELLPSFATYQNVGVHLVGDGNTISFVMQQDKAPLVASVLYYAEQLSPLVSQVARRLGG